MHPHAVPLRALAVACLVAFLAACEADPTSPGGPDASAGDAAVGADVAGRADAPGPADTTPPVDTAAPPVDTAAPPDDATAPPVDAPADSAPPADTGGEDDTTAPPLDPPRNAIDDWTYLIVTPADFVAAWAPLVEWRRRTGLPTAVVTMESIRAAATGRDDAEILRTWLQDVVFERDVRIVLLGGDTPLVPHRTIYVHTKLGFGDLDYETDAWAAAELYFSDLDGDWDANGNGTYGEFDDGLDMLPDVAVGRVPAADAAAVADYVDKVLDYEAAAAADYQDRVLFLSEYTGFGSLDASLLLDTWDGPLFGEGFAIEKLYDDPRAYPDAAPNTRTDEIRAMEDGVGVVAHLGHGSEGSFAFLDIDDVSALAHAPRYNVFFSCACYSGNFAAPGATTGERFVLNPVGGGVAYVGNTDIGIGFPSGATYLAQIIRLLLAADPPRLGEAFAEARGTFIPGGGGIWDDLHADRYTMFVVDLLGDPGLRMWRGLPRPVTLDVPARHAADTPLTVRVTDGGGAPVAAATVTLYQPDARLFVARTDADGAARFGPVSADPGVLEVTASGADVRPQTATITVE